MALNIDARYRRPDWSLDVSLRLPDTGVCALYGPSGCGKTSLLRIVAGLDRGQGDSTISLNSECWQRSNHFLKPEHRAIGYVFQDGRLFPHLTVSGNLDYARRRRFSRQGPDTDEVCRWLQIDHLSARKPHQLSGGEQQRTAIARALVSAPRLLLLDEPLSGLDSDNRENAMALLEDLHRRLSIPVIYVSHQLDEVMRLADHVVLMRGGRIEGQGSVEQMTTSLDSPLVAQSGAGSVVQGTVSARDEDYGLSEVVIDETTSLTLAQNAAQTGAVVRLRIPAEAVSLSRTRATDSSVLNILSVRIEDWKQQGESHVLVQLRLGQHSILARITRKSLSRLQLRQGDTLYAQIKGVALLSDYSRD